MARTAAVVGTATATRNAVNRRQADKNAQAYASAMNSAYGQQPAPQYAPPPPSPQQYYAPAQDQNYQALPEQYYAPPPPPPAPDEDMITQLERLGALKAQGLLTDEEFVAAKQKLLGT
jgi:type II secretory pathway pseudopilin PulG